jgi:membrane-bound lytic murein transglycosylase A
MIAQDTGSAIVGPARADLYWGAGDQAGRIAGRVRQAGRFTMLIPREIDPVEAGARMPMPLPRPVRLIAAQHQPKVAIAAPKGAASKGAVPKGAASKGAAPKAQPPAAQPPTPQRVRGSRRYR